MPELFQDFASRLDHVMSAILPGQIDKLNFKDSIKLSINMPTSPTESTQITINNISTSVPFQYYLDAKGVDQAYINYGFASSCSILNGNVYTFNHELITLNEELKKSFSKESENNEILFVAECANSPKLAIFIAYKEEFKDFDYVKVYVGGSVFLIQATGGKEPKIQFEGQQIDLPYIYPQEEDPLYWDFRVTLTEEDIIEIDIRMINTKIQYNMENILSLSILSIYKGKMCGICNLNKKSGC